jgi:hypothetical protein
MRDIRGQREDALRIELDEIGVAHVFPRAEFPPR